MARPDDNERKRIQARRDANGKARADAAKREGAINAKVQAICDNALARIKAGGGMPDIPALVDKLDRAYELAMVTRQPSAAVAAVMAQGRLLGLVIDKSAVLHASAKNIELTGPVADVRQRLVEQLSERVGSKRAERIVALLGKSEPEDDEPSEPERDE